MVYLFFYDVRVYFYETIAQVGVIYIVLFARVLRAGGRLAASKEFKKTKAEGR
ncbi:MAG: hypothetical protein GY947_09990 [Rhodobacteraceae bacterium]|nr:hypothetical protein [Paracoccaceae bacterium]